MGRLRSVFTEEEMAILEENPVVAKVSDKTVRFTDRFKEEFHERYCNGERPEDIFRSAGVDPELLGHLRVQGFVQNLVRKAAEGGDFADRRFTKHELASLRTRMVYLSQRVARLEQYIGIDENPGQPVQRATQGGQ